LQVSVFLRFAEGQIAPRSAQPFLEKPVDFLDDSLDVDPKPNSRSPLRCVGAGVYTTTSRM
jgi:hypothetical protein